MADDLEDAPWATKKKDAIAVHPVDDSLPDAPWAAQQPGVVEDVAKALPTGVAQGAIAIPGMAGDLQHLAKAGSDAATAHGLNPFSWMADKFANSQLGQFLQEDTKKHPTSIAQIGSGDMPGSYEMPTSHDIQGQVEKVTGPFYQAKTPLGKAAQTTGQVAPMLAAGGEGLIPTAIKSIASGGVSEGAGEAADALKGYLPEKFQPWAEPVARAVGAIAGSFAPAGARRVVTPLPMSADQATTVAALKAKDPNFPMTAGQMTNSPNIMALEGRTPRFNDLPAKQEDAFTRGTMKEMGVDGLATPENVAKGSTIGDQIGAIRRGNEINPNEFPQLNKDVALIVRKHAGVVGKDNAALLADIQKQIRLGASNSPNVASMPGARYDYMRQKLQTAIDSAGTGTENKALSDVRQALDDAFHRSIPPDQSAALKKLETQYANYKVLSNKTPTGSDTVTPKEVSAAVAKGFGNSAVNENRGSLAPWARNASKVMKDLPPPNDEGGAGTKLLGTILGGVGGGGAGLLTHTPGMGADTALVGGILGRDSASDIVKLLKNGAGRVVGHPWSQGYLKNQIWMPGANTSADPSTIARLLMSPPETQLVTDQSK